MGRAPFGSKCCPIWHALFESRVPVERGLAPAYRYLIRSRAAVLQGAVQCDQEDVSATGSQTASCFVKLGVAPAELGAAPRLYVAGIPPFAASEIGVRAELAGLTGSVEPLGVIAGVVFAMVTFASYSARLKWPQRLGSRRASCMLRGMVPRNQGDKSVRKSRPGFVEIANKRCLDEQYGHTSAQPGDRSCVWGVNSSAVLPPSGLRFRADVAQRRGYRMPTLSDYEKGANLGVLLVVADPDAAATAPGVAPESGVSENAAGCSLVRDNAALLGKVFASRFGD